MTRRFSHVSHYSYGTDYSGHDEGVLRNLVAYALDEPIIPSPSDSNFDSYPFPSPLTPTELSDSYQDDTQPEDGQQAATSTAVVSQPKKPSYPDPAMIAHCPVGSPLFDFCAPAFSEFSDKQNRRALVDHFCNVLSHLIVFREETGNPFQQLVLPLTRRDSPVTYAIFALASAHLEYRGVENAEKSLYFHNMAIRGVAQLIQDGSKVNRNEILAAIMLLVYYECVSVPTLTQLRTNCVALTFATARSKRSLQHCGRTSQGGSDYHGHHARPGRLDKCLSGARMLPFTPSSISRAHTYHRLSASTT